MELAMTNGFSELSFNEMEMVDGGKISAYIPHPIFPFIGIKVTYNNDAAARTAGWTAGGAIGGAAGGPAGAACGAAGGFVGNTVNEMVNGEAKARLSFFGF